MSQDVLDRIKLRLDAVGISAAAASRAATGSPDTIRNIERDLERGKHRSVTLRTAERLSAPLKTNATWLLTGEGDPESLAPIQVRHVPVVALISAGRLETAEAVESFDDVSTIPVAGLPDGDWIALVVSGDSMDRVAPHGSTIFVNRRERELRNGSRYAFITETGEGSFKRYRSNPPRFEPESTNPQHEAIFPDGKVSIVGRAYRAVTEL